MVQRIVPTHRPIVPDLYTLLAAFLDPEEKWQILEAAQKHYKAKWATINNLLLGHWPQVGWPQDLLSPSFEINANDPIGIEVLREAQEAIIQGLKKGVPITFSQSTPNERKKEEKEHKKMK
ncbi:hypothetical protein E2320_002428, partial [Naja naja]